MLPVLGLALSLPTTAAAATQCMTIAAFNDYMTVNGLHTTTATLRFDVTNVDPNDYFGSKGALAEFADSSCAGVTGFTTKLYGPDDPPNLSHPPGTLKQEYNDECCGQPSCPESWADPNASDTIFVDGSEQCEVSVWIDPVEHGYHIDCGGLIYDAAGPNLYDVQIDRASILVGVNGTTWAMPNAVSTWNEICFEDPGVDPMTPEVIDLPVIEDVTASTAFPATVYPDENDLSCGAGDSELYLKFDLSAVPGQVESAELHLHALADSSANGDGGDLYRVDDDSWSEATLTWNNRPPTAGASLDRVSPVVADQGYVLQVPPEVAVSGEWLSLALVPQPGDQNGVHFHSSESSAVLGPFLRVSYVAGGTGDGGSTDGGSGDGDSTDGGTTDGSSGGTDGIDTSDGSGDEAGSGLTGGGFGDDGFGSRDAGGCGCVGAEPPGRAVGWASLALLGLLGLRRRRV